MINVLFAISIISTQYLDGGREKQVSKDPIELLSNKLDRIADLLERGVAGMARASDLNQAEGFVWQPEMNWLQPIEKINRVDMKLLKGIDRVRDILVENTEKFAYGHTANNALLWGARGMGKSSLIKAVHAEIGKKLPLAPLKLIEIHREEIETLPALMGMLRGQPHRIILFCDDLSFDNDDTSYKSLKAALDGGVEGRPENTIFYATSNRRHLLPRDMIENERSTAITPAEAVEEKVSLSDRFGLWLGFHKCSQDEYLAMVQAYVEDLGLVVEEKLLHQKAREWATTRGSRSGRVAWQFVQDLSGTIAMAER